MFLRRSPVVVRTVAPTRGAGGTRGAKGWGWFFKAKEEIARGEDALPEYPANLDEATLRPRVFLDVDVDGVEDVGGEQPVDPLHRFGVDLYLGLRERRVAGLTGTYAQM